MFATTRKRNSGFSNSAAVWRSLMERPCAEWPLGRVLDLLYRDTLNRAALQALAMLPHCPPAWRPLIERRLATGHVEDWSKRLAGQA